MNAPTRPIFNQRAGCATRRIAPAAAGLLCVFTLCAHAAVAPTNAIDLPDFATANTAVSNDELADMRGGYEAAGFDFSFGLTALTRVNNEPLVTQTLLQLNDVVSVLKNMPRSSTGRPAAVPETVINLAPIVVQAGNNNYIEPDVVIPATGTVTSIIQNSLDNQHLLSARVYDLDVRGLMPSIRRLNASIERSALQHQLVESR
jgi:hypothetical protein